MRRWLILAAMLIGVATAAEAQPLQTSSATIYSGTTTAAVPTTTLSTSQMSVVAVQIIPGSQDTYRIDFQASLDGTNWNVITCYPQGSSTGATSLTTTATASQVAEKALWRCNVAGYARFRVNLATITAKSGTGITVRAIGFQNPFSLGG